MGKNDVLFKPVAWSGREHSRKILAEVEKLAHKLSSGGKILNFMEVCGTHTMAIASSGLRSLLPKSVRMLSGPGCPVCVSSQGDIDRVLEIARRKDVIITTFGDMMKVKGSDGGNLHSVRMEGGDVRVVYSPLDALELASEESGKKVVFVGVGFETTAPLIARTVMTAEEKRVTNFFVAPIFKLVPPALELILGDKSNRISGFILPGHVSVILGSEAYSFLEKKHGVPSVISGFEPLDILQSVKMLLLQIRDGRSGVEVEYIRAVGRKGNRAALAAMKKVFRVSSAHWRAVGEIPDSGLVFSEKYSGFDAFSEFGVEYRDVPEPAGCICGRIIMGKAWPNECGLFGTKCTPADAVGPCMVSSEGACAAWYKYGGLSGARQCR